MPETESKVITEMPRLHNQDKLSETTREKQTEGWKLSSMAEKEEDEDYKDFRDFDLCFSSSPHCGHIVLCPCLQIRVY